ncbi:S-layer homology domain-containing protein [Filifactor alocis]
MENNKRRRIYQNRRSLPTRLLAFVLCMVLTLTYSGVNTFAMSDDARGDSEKEIIAFSSLPDGVREQEIRQGEDLSAVTFPDTLQILVEETALVDKNSTSKDKALPKAMQSELPLVETKEEEAENSVKADVEETAEPAKDNTSAEESVEAEKSDTSVEPAQSSDENELLKETTLKDVTLQNVRWEIDEENSSKPVFSSENIGDSFVFEPVIPEQYRIAEDVELPKIHVSIRDKTSAKTAFDQSAVVDGVKISVKADDGVFQDAKALKVRKVSNSEAEKVEEAIEDKREGDRKVAVSYTFDISVLDHEGNEVQPDTTKGEVSVSFQMEEAKNQNLSADIYHVDETSQAEKLETEVKGEEVSAKTDGFSFYTVEFTYGNMQYVLLGDSTIDLSEILAKVGLSGEVTAVSVSNSALFSATKNADNQWLITAHRAFDTKEWMKVTINGVVHEIAVTDSQHPLTVTGGIENVDYKWENYSYNENLGDHSAYKQEIGKKYILHILTSQALVIEGDATQFNEGDGGAIVIPESVKANITLKNTKIFPMVDIPPMVVMKNAECKLTLEGENTLTPRLLHVTAGAGAFDKVPAIWVPEGAKLTVSEASTGTLTAESAYQHAVIGGWRYGHAGTITIDGGTLKLNNDGDINSITNISGPCIGGHGKLDGITINGGKIEATCVQSAPIGMSYEPIVDVDSQGKVIVNGGTIVTRHQTRDGVNPYYADGIGDTQHHTFVDVRINGGNVNTDFDRTRPKNDTHYGLVNGVYRVKITLLGAGEGQEITSYTMLDGSTKYLQDTKTLPNGELYLWLPPVQSKIITSVHCGGQDYTGVVTAVDNDTDAQAVFRTGTTGTGTLTASLKAEHVQGVKLSQTTGLSAGDTVYLSFSGVDSGYLFKGMCLYTGTTLPPAPREVGAEFTKIKDKLYSFTMPAENVTVYLNVQKIHTISAGEEEHIQAVSFTPSSNLTTGDTVTLRIKPKGSYQLSGMALRKATDPAAIPQDISSDFTKLSENTYRFVMPDYDARVDFKCEPTNEVTAGDFVVKNANCNFNYDEHHRHLELSGNGRATITMRPGVTSTSDRIWIEPDANINLTIKDLTISSSRECLYFSDIGECRLILEGNNRLTSNAAKKPAIYKDDIGKLTITGSGKLTATALGNQSCGIGGFVQCKGLSIAGGTIYAQGNNAMGIGYALPDTYHESAIYYQGGTVKSEYIGLPNNSFGGITGTKANVVITGGSIRPVNSTASIQSHKIPENGQGTKVYLTTITLGNGATLAAQAKVTALTGAGTYGINQMYADEEGKLYLWLPNGTAVTKVETEQGSYIGSVTANDNNHLGDAAAVFTLEKRSGQGSVALSGWRYGETAKTPVPTSTTNGTDNVSYTYFTDEACTTKTTRDNSGADSIGGVPRNVGRYYIQATFAETPRYKAFTAKAGFAISKATVSFTPPTPKTGLTYTGETQELINAGTVDASIGKLTYSLSETGTYSETIPSAKDADTYRVYYKVVGTNANYDYINAKGNIEVSIGKVSITPTVAISGWTYGTSPNAPTVTGNKGNGAVTYEYFTDENCTTKTTAANSLSNSEGGVPKNAGKYWVQATIAETENYNGATAKAGFEIKKANQTALSIKNVTAKKYGDADFTLETTGGSGNGALSYSVSANDVLEINGDKAKIVGAGTVTVTAVKAGGNNYNETSATLDITIAKGDEPAIAFPTASELTYGQALSESTLTGGSTEYGTFAWKDGSTIPTIDNTGYDVVFKPNATALKNYNIEEKTRTIEVTVKKGNQTGFAITAISEKTYGDSEFKLTTTGGSGNGAVSYSVSANNGVLFIAGDTAKIIGAGTVEITAVKAADANYNEASSSISITIAKKKLIVRADDKMIARNDPMPTFTSTAEGLVNGDTLINPTFTTTAANTGTNGKYEIIVNGGTLKNTAEAEVTGNYEITYQKGELTIVEKLYEAEVINGSGSGRYLDGQTVHIKALDKSGYTFSGWTSPDGVVFAKPLEKETDFVMPAKDVKVTATYRSNSSGSSYGYDSSDPKDDDSSISIKTEKAPDLPTIAEITVKAKKGEDKTATAKLSEKTTEKAIKKAKEEAKKKGKEANGIALEINMTMPKGTDKVQMHLSESTLEKMVSGEVKHLTVNGSFAKVVFDKNAMFEIQKQSSGNVTVNVIPVKKLSKAAEKLIGKRPVYDISLRSGNGKKITAFGNGTATVFLSYKAEKKEAIGGLYAVYVDEKEKASKIEASAYDVNSSSVIFKTNHLSVYGVGYTAPSERFDDIKNHWAKDFIEYVAGRGLITGSTKTTFSPDENMTRGMLVATLGRLAGVNGKNYDTNSFSDVQKDSPYRPYIEWAYSKGIVYGIGDGTFAPDKSITREEMAVIFERYAKATGYHIPVNRQANIYADKENIGSEYKEAVTAMQQSGIMMGVEGNRFNPKGTATRAEVSAMLGRYIKLMITPETAQGFAMDDAGKYRYYKDGKALTGKQTLNGMVYFFDESGVLQTGWVKDGNRWRYYDGAKAHKGWLHLKTDGEEKIYYLNKEGLLESGKWVKIDGKWYYFYPDGTLAVNTKIDGYEIDSKGVRKEK